MQADARHISPDLSSVDQAISREVALARFARWLLVPVILVAVGLRVWGIEAGLPVVYHPDEPDYVTIAQNIFKTGDLNPHAFSYPSLFFYLNALAYVPFYVVGGVAGAFNSPWEIAYPNTFLQGVSSTAMPATFLLGRFLTLAFGVGSVALVFTIGRRLTGSIVAGLLAALVLSVSVTNVVYSRLIVPDTFVVFFALLAFWGAVQVYQRGDTRDYIFAGVAVGLAAGTKYNGVLIALALVVAHFLRHGWRGVGDLRLYMAGVLSAATFLVTTPFALLDSQAFMAGLQGEMQHYRSGHLGMEGATFEVYMYYLRFIEGPIFWLALLEIGRGIVMRSKPVLLMAAFPVVYFYFIVQFIVRNDRTLLPALPFVYLLGASFVANLAGMKVSWLRPRLQLPARGVLVGLAAVLAVSALAVPLGHTVTGTSYRLAGVEAREQARRWIEENVPPNTRIAVESYGPYIDQGRYSVLGSFKMIDHPLEWYVENGYEYLVFNRFTFKRFYEAADRYPAEVQQYDAMFASLELVKSFPHPDYETRIYRTRAGTGR